jgi:hypothetical protein
MNFPGYESGYIINTIAMKLRDHYNIRTIHTSTPANDVLFITREIQVYPSVNLQQSDSVPLVEMSIPRYAIFRSNIEGIQLNQYDWWMNIRNLNQTMVQSVR